MAHPAIEQLYDVFGSYPFRHGLDGCFCCHGPGAEEALRSHPLREIPADTMFGFMMDVMWTVGDVEDFKHFLPRALELVFEDDDSIDVETVLGKLPVGEWRTWPQREQLVIEQFLHALWEEALAPTMSSEGPDASSVLASLAVLRFDLQPFLDRWLQVTSEGAQRELAEFVIFEIDWPEGQLSNPWWPDDRFGETTVLTWFRQPEVTARLRAASDQDLAANAIQLLGT